jgi:hypothetical protein
MESRKNWMEYFRLVTPFLLILFGIIGWFIKEDVSRINLKLEDIDHKMFVHLTNDEMHSPRSLMVTKAEFLVYQSMRDKQMGDLKDIIYDIRKLLERHMEMK